MLGCKWPCTPATGARVSSSCNWFPTVLWLPVGLILCSLGAPCSSHPVQSHGSQVSYWPHLVTCGKASCIAAGAIQDPWASAGLKLRTLSRKWSGMSAGGEGTWVMAFEDLQRAPASKLFPLVRVLLQADSLMETGDAATLTALAPGKVGISKGRSLDGGVV